MAMVYRLHKKYYIWINTQFVDLDMFLSLVLNAENEFDAAGHPRYMAVYPKQSPILGCSSFWPP